ncbi:hypothetical protein BDA96_03G050600 [Sorghum bicolor]|uniref:Uncharacterized protein n=2 Tax=Sorghum bicolor TaxID=4558 RepID=A0A921R9C4_SORBI|nr:hypothetical protein BDA96_03G050600 [Sorghum bicolor]OQU86219.1 hypothetical protein SORBI_3003G047450 [Sorghum bicolor]
MHSIYSEKEFSVGEILAVQLFLWCETFFFGKALFG